MRRGKRARVRGGRLRGADGRVCRLEGRGVHLVVDLAGCSVLVLPGGSDHGQGEDGEGEEDDPGVREGERSEEHTSELQSLMRISYDVFCLKKKKYSQKM